MTNNYNVVCAYDGGNGYIKASIDSRRFIFPSLVSRVFPGNEPQVVEASQVKAIDKLITDYVQNMDITTQSNSIHTNGRYLVGMNALNSGQVVTGFNVSSTEGKHNSDVSIISLLGMLAYNALQKFWIKNHNLPKDLDVTVDKMATALPISEYKIKGVKESYAKRFSAGTHVVIINNFSDPITVKVKFSKVAVQAEGVIAQYGLIGSNLSDEQYRKDGLFDEFKKHNDLKDFTGYDISRKKYILLIDVGEGTVDFSVLHNTSPVPQINTSINMGTGNIVENAIKALRGQYPIIGQIRRQTFTEIAARGKDKESETYRQFLNEQLVTLEDLISEQVKSIYAQLNGQVDMVALCGGGIKVLREAYEKPFSKLIKDLSPFGPAQILWVPAKYTQYLNLDGLEFRLRYL